MDLNADYGSEFEYDSEAEKNRKRRQDFANKCQGPSAQKAKKEDLQEKTSREEGLKQRYHLLSLDAYSRHKKLINDYFLYHKSAWKYVERDRSKDRTDADIIRENHRFIWNSEDEGKMSWDMRLAKQYYDKLFKEYCIADLSKYKENKIAMRWRTENEVVSGKGQFLCGSKRCDERDGLKSWELNFAYQEHGEKKNALVKLRLCPGCSTKLNYHHRRKEAKRKVKGKEVKQENREEQEGKSEEKRVEGEEKGVEEGSASTSKGQDEQTSSEQEGIWAKPLEVTEEKSREEEFEDYLADMLL